MRREHGGGEVRVEGRRLSRERKQGDRGWAVFGKLDEGRHGEMRV